MQVLMHNPVVNVFTLLRPFIITKFLGESLGEIEGKELGKTFRCQDGKKAK